jgi:starch-binding outer membrane protein, SusD/RagB family
MKKILFFISISVFLCSSCNFLDLESPTSVKTENLFKDADGVRNARIGMYAALASANYYGGMFPLATSCYSDDGANGGFTVQAYDELGSKTLSPANAVVGSIWLAIYNANNAANQILSNMDRIDGFDEGEKVQIKAEALFVRGLCHFDALRTWGEHWDLSSADGVPIISSPQAFDTAVKRASVQAVYNFIIKDLAEAEKTIPPAISSKNYINLWAIKALTARVALYKKDKVTAAEYAKEIINKGTDLSLLPSAEYGKVFTTKTSPESIFEIGFNTQNRSNFNQWTYVRDDASRTEVIFLAAEDLGKFFDSRKNDARAKLVNFTGNNSNISPDGRTEKYRGEQTRDNPAYVLRLAEMYLILAEVSGRANGLATLNTLREKRNMPKIASVSSDAAYQMLILEERRAELNWEGHRYFDLARLAKVADVLGKEVNPNFPIPAREIIASGGTITQNKGY